MALEKAYIPVAFSGGIERKLDHKQVPPAKLLDLQNGVFTKGTTIVKRNGYRALGTTIEGSGAAYEDPQALASRDDELLAFADGHCYSHRPTADRWSDTGIVASVVARESPLARTGTEQSTPDVAVLDGVALVAWEDSRGGVWWSTVEHASGRILRAPEQIDADGQRPRCVPCGSVLHLYWARPATRRIYVAVVNPASPTNATSAAILTEDLDAANPAFDAMPTPRTGAPAAIAWIRDSAAGGGYRVGYVDGSGVLGSPATGHPSVATAAAVALDASTAIAVSYGSEGPDLAVVATSASPDVIVDLWDVDALTPIGGGAVAPGIGPAVRAAAAWRGDSGSARDLFWAVEIAGSSNDTASIVAGQFNSDEVIVAAEARLRGHGLVSRAFEDGGEVYVGIVADTPFFAYAAVVQGTGGWGASVPVVARLMPGIAHGLPLRAHVASVVDDASDDRVHGIPLSYNEQLEAVAGSAQFAETGIRLAELDFDSPAAWQSTQLGRGLYLGGACPSHYDGARWAEAGFHTAPDGTTTTSAGTGGGLTLTSTYVWRLVYEEVDAQGEVHVSAVSIGTTVALTGGQNRMTLGLPTYRLTRKGRVRISVFRSLANDDAQFFRVSSIDPSATSGSNRFVDNETTSDLVSFVDDMSDAVAATKEPLYTNGGILSNDPPPANHVLAGGKRRLFFGDTSDPHGVRYSQELREGFGVELAAELKIAVDPYGGDVTGLAILDDLLIIFKERAIYGVAGEGPLANPEAGGGFSAPALITSDVGCSNAASIASMPEGIVFQTAKGIYLLDRSRSVKYIGAPVEAYNSQRVTAATLIDDQTQVRFLTDSGRTLLWDFYHGQWSTFTNHEGLDAIVVAGTYHYLRTDGRVFAETVGAYRDDNSHIPIAIETAWLRLSQVLQTWQFFYHAMIIGEYISPHLLSVSLRTDYNNTWTEPLLLDSRDIYDGATYYGDGDYGEGIYGANGLEDVGGVVYQWRLHVGLRGQAMQLRFADVEAVDEFGGSFELTELLLSGGVKRGDALVAPERMS